RNKEDISGIISGVVVATGKPIVLDLSDGLRDGGKCNSLMGEHRRTQVGEIDDDYACRHCHRSIYSARRTIARAPNASPSVVTPSTRCTGGMKNSSTKQPMSPNHEKNGDAKRCCFFKCSAEKCVMANHIRR